MGLFTESFVQGIKRVGYVHNIKLEYNLNNSCICMSKMLYLFSKPLFIIWLISIFSLYFL